MTVSDLSQSPGTPFSAPSSLYLLPCSAVLSFPIQCEWLVVRVQAKPLSNCLHFYSCIQWCFRASIKQVVPPLCISKKNRKSSFDLTVIIVSPKSILRHYFLAIMHLSTLLLSGGLAPLALVSGYILKDDYSGDNFFRKFTFDTVRKCCRCFLDMWFRD